MAQTPTNAQGVVVYTPTQQLLYSMSDDSLVAIFKLSLLLGSFTLVYIFIKSYSSTLKSQILHKVPAISPENRTAYINEQKNKFYFKNWFNIVCSLLLCFPVYFVLKYTLIFIWQIFEILIDFL